MKQLEKGGIEMDKRSFLENTIQDIHALDIVNIMNRYMDLRRRGPHAHGLCPFHSDHTIGSFVVTPSKGMFKCFACGEGGDSISFVAKKQNISYIEAAFKIALDENIISQEEYDDNFKKRRYTKEESKNAEEIFAAPVKSFKKNLPEASVLNAYYEAFLSVMTYGKEGEIRLEEEDLKYLKEERGLSEELIIRRGYCSLINVTDSRIEKLMDELDKRNLNREGLQNIPGFFERLRKKTDNGEKLETWVKTFAYNEGVVLPMKNSRGQIVALQVRRREKDEFRGRYFWFSSGFANYNDKMRYGTSPGSPIDVLLPDEQPTQAIFITEGRFKSEAIVKSMRSAAISVQGVGNWKGIEDEIKLIQEITDEAFSHFNGYKYLYLAFDSDMRYKYQVYHQLKKMTDMLQEKMPEMKIKYLYWDTPEKGIDDLLAAKNEDGTAKYKFKEVVQMFDKEDWDTKYEAQINALMKEHKVLSPMDLHPELLKSTIHIKGEN